MSGKKVITSFSVTIILISLFILAAYGGGLDWFEARFYQSAVLTSYTDQLENAEQQIDGMFTRIAERLAVIVEQEGFPQVFQINQPAEAVQNRRVAVGRIAESYPSFMDVRVFGLRDERLHYSTAADDTIEQTPERTVYAEVILREDLQRIYRMVEGVTDPQIILDPETDVVHFSHPVTDSLGLTRGNAVWSFSIELLTAGLRNLGLLQVRERPLIIDENTILLNSTPERSGIDSQLMETTAEIEYLRSPDTDLSLVAVQISPADGYRLVLLRPEESFLLAEPIRAVIVAALSLTLFLTVFLLLNTRSDPVLTVRDRMKRLQLEVFQQFLESPDGLDQRSLERELDRFRYTMHRRLTAGLGRVNEDTQQHIEQLISTGWHDIHGLLAGGGQKSLDVDRLEQTLEQVLSRIQTVPAAADARGGARPLPLIPHHRPLKTSRR